MRRQRADGPEVCVEAEGQEGGADHGERHEPIELLHEQRVPGGESAAPTDVHDPIEVQAALEFWPENPEAKARLRVATELMLRAALDRGDAEAAARVMATADAIDPALEKEVAAARQAAAR